MPKKPTTTKEAMIEGAFRLIREKGHESLTARNLASFLGCSTQPIMYQFPNLDTLRDLTYQKADAFHTEYILAAGDLLEIGLRYVQFAKEEPMLFKPVTDIPAVLVNVSEYIPVRVRNIPETNHSVFGISPLTQRFDLPLFSVRFDY